MCAMRNDKTYVSKDFWHALWLQVRFIDQPLPPNEAFLYASNYIVFVGHIATDIVTQHIDLTYRQSKTSKMFLYY